MLDPTMLYQVPTSELSSQSHRLFMLNRACHQLASLLEMSQLLSQLLQITQTMTSAGDGFVWLWNEAESNTLLCSASLGPGSRPASLKIGQGVAGWVAQTKQTIAVPAVTTAVYPPPEVLSIVPTSTYSLVATPLRVREQILGVVELVNKPGGLFTPEDVIIIEALAASAAIAIDNAHLFETMRQQTADLMSRNEELDAFAHTVAHDLQNPLSLVSGFTELLLHSTETLSEEDKQQALRAIAGNIQRMSNIVQELLLLSSVRQKDIQQDPLDMHTIVIAALERLAYMVQANHTHLTLPQQWPVAVGYAPWVEEVWENYISNAIKYGGKPPEVELGSTVEGNMIRFWIRDNGNGLSQASQHRLFMPFTKLNQIRVTGFGLGLSIVRRIVEKLGGQVGVESEIGKGSVFSFTLPAVKEM